VGGRRGGRRTRKSIFDPVHGPIALDGVALGLIATPEFQRLWGVRQTGFAHLVFPGANHTRLEHSLGTYWVAGRMAERLELGPDAAEHVAVAGLLHDLGHPPFSHTLDLPLREVLGVGHERLSRDEVLGKEMPDGRPGGSIPAILERFGLRPRSIADLIDPPSSARSHRLPASIIHGAIDADRIDYLQRDAHYTGVAHGATDAVRLLDTVRPAEGRLAFAEKGRSAVEGFLVGRTHMYSSVYYHKTVRAAEMMAQAAVERMPGYPDGARGLFGLTDGELLVRLQEAGEPSASLVRGLLERRLHKRALGWRTVRPGSRRRWLRLIRAPAERRQLEDDLAERIHAPPGSVLLDLAGLAARGDPGSDWGAIGVVVDGRVTYPFRGPGPWRTLALRPPSDWAVSVYVAARHRDAAARAFASIPRALP
jgi:uncharacterized protein